ncbi:MAG: hypothetical protein H6707_00620 [Deltaproteobacteria bacterium]|nr:hypothetical protein [Deltaproteobacteria bacterium]
MLRAISTLCVILFAAPAFADGAVPLVRHERHNEPQQEAKRAKRRRQPLISGYRIPTYNDQRNLKRFKEKRYRRRRSRGTQGVLSQILGIVPHLVHPRPSTHGAGVSLRVAVENFHFIQPGAVSRFLRRLELMHGENFVNNAISLDNVMVDSSGELRLVEWKKAQRGNPVSFASELKDLSAVEKFLEQKFYGKGQGS